MLEVTKTHEKGCEYLVARRSLIDGTIVLFFSKNTGIVIKTSPDSETIFGDISNDWISCSDNTIWEPVDITITG